MKPLPSCKTLNDLWDYVDYLHRTEFPHHTLRPILGNGQTKNPKIMFIFINPTARNISSDPQWKGPRFPFIGTKQIWRIFHRAGLFEDTLMSRINNTSTWSLEFTNKVLHFLQKKEFYLTNIVKWTGSDATLPDAEKINLFLPLLEKEIELVQPEYIVTLGLIPFEKLTKQKIKLGEYYAQTIKSKQLQFFPITINFTTTKVVPCYFPVGRGDPKKAVELLQMINAL